MLLKTNKKSPIQYLNPGALSAEKWAHGDGRTKKSEQEPRDRSGWRLIPPLPPRGPTAEGCGRGAGGPEACLNNSDLLLSVPLSHSYIIIDTFQETSVLSKKTRILCF